MKKVLNQQLIKIEIILFFLFLSQFKYLFSIFIRDLKKLRLLNPVIARKKFVFDSSKKKVILPLYMVGGGKHPAGPFDKYITTFHFL